MVENKPISDTESVIQHNNDVTDKTISLLNESYMSDNIPDINLHNLHIDNNGQYGYTTPLVQNIVQIKIENVSYPAMIDSGASHCIISKDAFNALPKHTQQQMCPIETSCKLANNTHIKTIGVISLTIHIQQSSCQIPLYIIDSCVQPIILGLTFLHKAKATLSFDSQTITVQKPYSVITTNQIELKPFSDTVISGRLCGNVQQIDVLDGECLPQNLLHSDIHVVICSSAVTLADGIIPVCLRNTSVTPLCLHKKYTIIPFQPLSKARYDKNMKQFPLTPGDTVYLHMPRIHRMRGLRKKLIAPFHGPYLLVSIRSPTSVMLKRLSDGKYLTKPVSIHRIKRAPLRPKHPLWAPNYDDDASNEDVQNGYDNGRDYDTE